MGNFSTLPVFLKLTNTDPFAAWFVVTGDVTPGGIRVVRSVLGAITGRGRYRVTSLIRKCTLLGPYRRLMPRVKVES